MTIYLDSDYKCHTESGEGLIACDCEFFDGKCVEFIEGYRYVPSGSAWTRADGVVFYGEMIAPWKDVEPLLLKQQIYELTNTVTTYEHGLNTLGVQTEEVDGDA